MFTRLLNVIMRALGPTIQSSTKEMPVVLWAERLSSHERAQTMPSGHALR